MPCKVRIVRAPIGEAPQWVREAWIGLELPVVSPRKRAFSTVGILTGPTTFLASIWALRSGKTPRVSGYVVRSDDAIRLLAPHNPEAAGWWRDNAPAFARRRRLFLFDAPACQLIWDPAPSH